MFYKEGKEIPGKIRCPGVCMFIIGDEKVFPPSELNRKTKYDMFHEYIFIILSVICNEFATIIIVNCDIFFLSISGMEEMLLRIEEIHRGF